MNYTAIKVDDYWIIYFDYPMMIGDTAIYFDLGNNPDNIHKITAVLDTGIRKYKTDRTINWVELYVPCGRFKKVIACSKELNGLPVFVPEWENDAELNQLAMDDYNKSYPSYEPVSDYRLVEKYRSIQSFERGYSKAKEKYQFTLEDMSKAFFKGYYLPTEDDFSGLNSDAERAYHKLIESLTKPKQYQVEIGSVSDNRIEVKSWKEM